MTLSRNGGNYRTDQRWVEVRINESFLCARSPGHICYQKDAKGYCDHAYVAEIGEEPRSMLNNGISYMIHRSAVQSVADQFTSETYTHEHPDSSVRYFKISVPKFVNTGIYVSLQALYEE